MLEETLISSLVWRDVGMGGETRCGECVGVVLLDPRGHFFANQAPQIKVLEGVLDEVAQGNDEAAEVPYFDDDVGRVDLFDTAPFSLNDDDIVDADGFGDGNLETREEVGGGRFGGGGDDQRRDAGGGEQAGAVVPDARIVEGPQQSTDVDDDDKGDEHASKELELGMEAAGPEI